jgi:3-hydroxyisobutyrate dehydrogenase-like beta-hydroxyacid dehydrogenase
MRLGFIGLGNMGNSIARDLVTPGNTVTVYDVREDVLSEFTRLGADRSTSPAGVAAASDIVGICVRTDEDVLDVLNGPNGILSAAHPGLIVAIHSTIHLATLDRVVKIAEEKGVRIVDAPVTRGTNAPKHKAVVFMVGGMPDDVEKVIPYVALAALKVVRTGKRGSAMALKISNNLITYLMVITLRDAVRLAEAAGVDLKVMAEVLSANGVAGPNMLFSVNRRAGATTEVHHAIDSAEANAMLGEKDLSCALDAASFLGVRIPAAEMACKEIRAAMLEMLR